MLFMKLPNEIIYLIFDFLTSTDILRSFTQLNNRCDYLVRSYIKILDLTNDWNGNQEDLQWICQTIKQLKIDQLNIYLLVNCQYFQLYSLYLRNVSQWNELIMNMNLKILHIYFDDKRIVSFDSKLIIPQTIIQFSTNRELPIEIYHSNLINLKLYVNTMSHLIEIIKQTSFLQYLSVTFAKNFDIFNCIEKYSSDYFQTMIINFQRLKQLTCLSFSTQQGNKCNSNLQLPFDQIQIFIDQCCPNKEILKKITMKFYWTIFNEEFWSIIEQYKIRFDQFNFYGSFLIDNKLMNKIERIFLNQTQQFIYHIEQKDILLIDHYLIHIYSLPFYFNRLYGFTSYSKLNSYQSFSHVRYLYIIENDINQMISFHSIAKLMPNLISIDCNISPFHDDKVIIPNIILDEDIFHHVRFLYFQSNCYCNQCVRRNLLCRLLDRMPNLKYLNTSNDSFLLEKRQYLSIKQLIYRKYKLKSIDMIIKCLPQLTTLTVDHFGTFPYEISTFISSIFIRLSLFKSISSYYGSKCIYDQKQYEKSIQKALILVQTMNHSLRHVTLDFECGTATFYRRNF